MLEHRRVGRAHTDGPFASKGRQVFARQVQTFDQHLDFALTQAALRQHRNLQGDALALLELQGLALFAARNAQLALSADFHVQLLCLARQVGDVQRHAGLVATGKKARRRQFGDDRRSNHGFRLGHAIAVVGPGLSHDSQLAVEVRYINADFTFTGVIERHRRALQRHDGDAGVRTFAALRQCIATERHACQSPLAGFDQLTVDVQLVCSVLLAAKQAGKRIGRCVTRDIEDADVHRRHQHVDLFGDAAVSIFGGDLEGQRLSGAHFLRRGDRQRQLALRPVQRQVQNTHGALGCDIGLALAGTYHQSGDVQVVARPFFVQRDVIRFAFGRHVDFLPPQRPFTGLDQQITLARSRRSDSDFRGVAIVVGRLVQRQLDLIRSDRAAVSVVLPAITGPEAQAADHSGGRIFHLDTVRTPFDREADLGGGVLGDADGLFVEVEEFLVEVVTPAVVGRVVPVVIATLADQPDFHVVSGQLVASRVGHDDFKIGRAVAVGLRLALGLVVVVVTASAAAKQCTHAGQVFGRPDRLHQTTGDRPPARLLQAGLQNQLQRRFGLRPLALHSERRMTFGIEGDGFKLQIMLEVFFGDRAELITRQLRHRLAQRADIDLTGQRIARSGGAVQVAASDIELRVVSRRHRRVAALELQRQTLGQEVLDLELVELRFAVAQVEHQLPASGGGFVGKRQLILVETIAVGFPDEFAADLIIGTAHFDGDGLRLDGVAVAVAQQAVE